MRKRAECHHWHKFGNGCKQEPTDTLSNNYIRRKAASNAKTITTSPVSKADVPDEACLHYEASHWA
jgi:hypothetical protein